MRHSLILMAITILSKIFGLFREISLSFVYGTGEVADAFLISFFIPSILINGITLGIATGFIPVYERILVNKTKDQADRFTDNIATIIFIIALLVSIVGIIFADEIISLLAIGLENEAKKMAVFFSKMVMVSISIASIGGVFRGYLQAYNKFPITVINQGLMNLIIIAFIFISKDLGYKYLGLGTAIGMIAQYLVFIPFLKRLDYKYKPFIDLKDENIKAIKRLALPVLVGVLLNETNIIVDKAIASKFQVGAISALNYSSSIQDFVVGVVILSIATVRYTEMSKLTAKDMKKELEKNYNITLKMTMFLVIPASIGLMVYSKEIVELLFVRGAFDKYSLEITQKSLYYYALGLSGIGLTTVGQRVFYAKKQIRQPLILSLITVGLNISLNLLLGEKMGLTGLALGTSLAMTLSGLAYIIILDRKDIKIKRESLVEGLGKPLLLSLLLIPTSKLLYRLIPSSLSLIGIIAALIVIYISLAIKTKILYKEDLKKIIEDKGKNNW